MTGRQAHVKAMVDVQKGGKMGRLIDEDDVVDWLLKRTEMYDGTGHFVDKNVVKKNIESQIAKIPTAQPERRWIPFKTRPLTKEEKEEHPEWDGILDCKLPDDGQRILVSVSARGHERVQYDEFYTDDGCYLDSGYEIGTEAVAWMPLPEPYRGGI